MAGKRIAVLDPNRQFGFIDEADLGKLPEGARVLTKQELQKRALEEEYAKQSTGKKIAGVGSVITGPIAANALAGAGATALQPQVEAFNQGVAEPATMGLDKLAVKKGLEVTEGGAAAKAYAEHQQALGEAHPEWKTAGEVAGYSGLIAGGTGGAAKLLPGAGVSALGGVAEGFAGRQVAKVVGKSVLGRAVTTGAELGARGAVEGGLNAGAQYTVNEVLQDHDLAADKVFAATGTGMLYGGIGGTVLGGAGSLAKSAVGGIGRGATGMAGKLAPKAETALVEGEAAGAAQTRGLGDVWTDLQSTGGQKGLAYDRAWGSLGGGFGLQSTEFTKRAQRYLPNGTRDVGEYIMRKGIINAEAGVIDAAKMGTPAAMVPKIAAAVEADGMKLGALTDASGGTIAASRLESAVNTVASRYEQSAATRPIGRAIRKYGDELFDSLGMKTSKAPIGTVEEIAARQAAEATGQATALKDQLRVQDVLRERKALDLMVFENAPLDPNITTQVKRELRGQMEGLVVDALDEASGKMKGELAAEYKLLKRDYLAGNIALEAAEDSSARAAKAGFLGLKDLTAGGGSILKSVGHKVVRERGDAAAAVALYNAAERGTLTKMVTQIDALIGRASKGLLTPPAKGVLPVSLGEKPRAAAQAAMARVAQYQASPEKLVDDIAHHTEAMSSHSPEIANAVTQRFVSAMSFMASKMPAGADPDPLDPHPAPHLSDSQAREFALYDWYTQDPKRFFIEVAHGKLTPEGAEVAQELMPGAFAQLQMMTAEALSTQMSRGNRIPFQQRLVLGQLLNFAAVPSQRPDHAAMLQGMLASAQQPPDAPAPHSRSSTKIATQQSALDRLEAGSPGKRS